MQGLVLSGWWRVSQMKLMAVNQGREMSAVKKRCWSCGKDTVGIQGDPKSIQGDERKFKKEATLGIGFE